jgi:hypothetical protein
MLLSYMRKLANIYVSQRSFINLVVSPSFLPNLPIAISSFPSVTFLKYCYWLVGQEYNTHVTRDGEGPDL